MSYHHHLKISKVCLVILVLSDRSAKYLQGSCTIMMICPRLLPSSPHAPIQTGRRPSAASTKGAGGSSAARPLWGIPYGWVCGGWEDIRRGKLMPNRAGIVAATGSSAKRYPAPGARYHLAKYHLAATIPTRLGMSLPRLMPSQPPHTHP